MPINPTTLKALIDTQITNETVDFAITPAEVGGRMKDTIDYTTEQIAASELLVNKSTNVAIDGLSNTKYPSVKAVKDYADSIVVGLLDDRGNYNASSNLFPSTGGSGLSGAVLKGDLWYISVTGTLGGVSVPVGASVRALVDNPAQTSTNWSILNVGLGFTPENVVNKSTNVATDGASDTKYPSVKAVKDYVDANSGGGAANYKILKGFINQSSTSNPSIVSFENTFPTLPTIVRTSVGTYNFNFSETIDANKIFCLIGNNANDALFTRMHIGIVSVGGVITVGVNRYRLRNGNATTDELFDGFTRVSFEIILYP
jgi:hypothetical protein